MATAVMSMPKLRLPGDIAVRRQDSATAGIVSAPQLTSPSATDSVTSPPQPADVAVAAISTAGPRPASVTRLTLPSRTSPTVRPLSAPRPVAAVGASTTTGTSAARRITPVGSAGAGVSAAAVASTFKRTATNLQMPTPSVSGRPSPQPARTTPVQSRPTSASGRATPVGMAVAALGGSAGGATGPRTGQAAPAAGSTTHQRGSATMARPMLTQTARAGASGVLANPGAIRDVPATTRPVSASGRTAGTAASTLSGAATTARPLLRHTPTAANSGAARPALGTVTTGPVRSVASSSRVPSPAAAAPIRPSPSAALRRGSPVGGAAARAPVGRTASYGYGRSSSAASAPGSVAPAPPVAAPRPVSPSGRLPSPAPVPPRKCPHCTVLLLDRAHAERHQRECAFAPTPCGAVDPANPTVRCLFIGRGAASVDDHRRECPLRPTLCPHPNCGVTVAFAALMEHLEGPCQQQPVPCHACGAEIARGAMGEHTGVHCPQALVACPLGCGHSFPRCDVAAHIRDQWADALHRTRVDPQATPAEHPVAAVAVLLSLLHEQRERALLDRLVSPTDEVAFGSSDIAAAAAALGAACDRISGCGDLSAVCDAARLRELATSMDGRVQRVTQALRQTGDEGNAATGLERRWALASLALHEAAHPAVPTRVVSSRAELVVR